MAKEKRTTLRPWQKEISQEEYIKKMKTTPFNVGFFAPANKFYETDFSNPEYIKHREQKETKKQEKKKIQSQKRAKRIEISINKAKRDAVKEFKKSDAFKKLVAQVEKRVKKELKPQMTAQDRLLKAQARLAKEQAKVNKLTKAVTN